VQREQALEVHVATIHDVEGAAGSGISRSRTLTSCSLPSEMWIKVGKIEQALELDRRFG